MYNFIRKLIALIVALIVYFTQKRLGMSVVSFFMIDLFLKEIIKFNIKTVMYAIFMVVLFIIGSLLSMHTAKVSYSFLGAKSFTFMGGFLGGIVEMEAYLLFALFPFKFIIDRNFKDLQEYILIVSIIFSIMGGLAQGSYLAGWQHILYV